MAKNLSDLPTPALPRRMPWHSDSYYAMMLQGYLDRHENRPTSFKLDMEAKEELRKLKGQAK